MSKFRKLNHERHLQRQAEVIFCELDSSVYYSYAQLTAQKHAKHTIKNNSIIG